MSMLNHLNSRQKINKFCVITTQRSGSTWMTYLLDNHPQINSYAEVFAGNPYGKNQWTDQRIMPCYLFRAQHNFNQRPFIIFQYFDYLEKTANDCQAIGFKLMYDQIGWTPEILIKLITGRYKIIHLIRNNYLDIVLSRVNAWNKRGNLIVHTTEKKELRPVNLNIQKIVKQMDKLDQDVKKYTLLLKYLPNEVMTITYESLVHHKLNVLQQISSFLEVENSGVQFNDTLQKLAQEPIKKR